MTDDFFKEHFFDARIHKPKSGQVMAKFTAMADFIDGEDSLKRDVIHYLLNIENGANTARVLLEKKAGFRYGDAISVLREMAIDLTQKNAQEVLDKPYRFVCEMFFYTEKQYIPDSPHWEMITLIDSSKWENFDKVMEEIEVAHNDV